MRESGTGGFPHYYILLLYIRDISSAAHCPTRASPGAAATENMPQTATLSHTDSHFTEEKS